MSRLRTGTGGVRCDEKFQPCAVFVPDLRRVGPVLTCTWTPDPSGTSTAKLIRDMTCLTQACSAALFLFYSSVKPEQLSAAEMFSFCSLQMFS